MKHTVAFEFSIRDRVLIREIQRPGVIEAITIDYFGIQYRVSYWDNSERKSVWLPEHELEERK